MSLVKWSLTAPSGRVRMNRRTTVAKEIVIREVRPSDAAAWAKLRTALWPAGAADHPREIAQFFAGLIDEPKGAFIVESPAGKPIAILELSIREDVRDSKESAPDTWKDSM
jgi:hypothetical protein